MATRETRRAIQARTAIGALLAAGAMLLVGPVSTAVAAPSGHTVTNPTGQSRDSVVTLPSRSQMSHNLQYLQLQSVIETQNKSFSMVSNILKKNRDTTSNILKNLK